MKFLEKAVNQAHENNIRNNINLELNGLRGVACLIIFIFHCRVLSGSPPLRPDLGLLFYLPLHGAYAVDLFFVLSGFFIILPYVKTSEKAARKFSYWNYYQKKAVRILPPYYLNLIFMFGVLVPSLRGAQYLFSPDGKFMLVTHFTFLQYLHPTSSSSLGINGALWTLSVTFQFFLVFPFIRNLFTDDKALRNTLLFILISVLWRYFCWYDNTLLYPIAFEPVKKYGVDDFTIRFFLSNQLPAQLSHFAIGMFLGNIFQRRHQGGLFCNFAALAIFSSTLYSFTIANLAVQPWWSWWRLWLAAGSGALLYLTAFNGPYLFKMLFRNRYLGFIGNLSYEIYLWHVMIFFMLTKTSLADYLQGRQLFWGFFIIGGAATLVISYGSIKLLSFFEQTRTKRKAQLHSDPTPSDVD